MPFVPVATLKDYVGKDLGHSVYRRDPQPLLRLSPPQRALPFA